MAYPLPTRSSGGNTLLPQASPMVQARVLPVDTSPTSPATGRMSGFSYRSAVPQPTSPMVRGSTPLAPVRSMRGPTTPLAEGRAMVQTSEPQYETTAATVSVAQAKEAAAMQAKIDALQQEQAEAVAKLQAVQEETNTVKKSLEEAQAAQKEVAALAASGGLAGGLSKQKDALKRIQSMSDGRSLPGNQGIIGRMPMDELDHHYDVVIIGGGPVGVAAAMKAAVLGHRCILVDKPKLSPMPNGLDASFGGPTGLWSKALRDVGKHLDVEALQSMHLDDDVIWHQVRNMCLRLACSNASHQVKTLTKFKIAYLQASATVISAKNVLVNQETDDDEPTILQTDYVLLATGSKPMRPKEIPFDDVRIFDSDSINGLSFLPKSVAVLGSGIIAIEYAKIFRRMGVKVIMLVRSECLSALERIGLDHDIAAKLIEVLHDDEVQIYENTSVVEWNVPPSREDGPLKLKLKSKNAGVPSECQVEIFLAATGRTPNTSGWGAEKLGIKLAPKGHVEVNSEYETSVPGIFAAGDLIGPPSLASTGVYQAQAAMLEMFGQGHMNKFESFPIGMWTTPECGYYGMTSKEATKKGIEVKEGCVTYDACLRGRVFAPVGLLKLVFRVDDGVIVGVHILGDDACELVHYGMDLVKQEVSIFKVMTTCFTAVTFHELFKEAALDGNSKLEFGLEWHKILEDIGAHLDNHEHEFDITKMKQLFLEIDTDGDGALDWKELMAVFHKYGCMIERATAANLVRLSVKEEGETAVHWDEFEKVFHILEDVRENSHFAPPPEKNAKANSRRPSLLAPPISGA
mmetsp:Transcript_104665/g.191112  ORF Transcript_104665/g.191112 Transcript_104665/m.191112 type:complete len:801 (-) Transcript_104665:171-2573(-)